MKSKWIVLLSASSVLSVLLACLLSRGGTAVDSTPFIALSSICVPELPEKAADLVHAAAASDRERTVQDTLRAVSALTRPGVLPYVVSAVCRTNPEVAGVVVMTATELQPAGVLIFSEAAVCAAPGQVEQVVFSACKAAPSSCASVALVAFGQLPSAHHLILKGLVGALPYLKPYVEKAQVQVGPDFEAVIGRMVELFNEASNSHAE
jgi:hypothetical protein